MHTFLISMPQSRQRRQESIALLHQHAVPFEIIDGVDVSIMRPDQIPCVRDAWGGGLLLGEVGCYASHINALSRIIDYGLPYACILEDDFCFESSAEFTLESVVHFAPKDFHYIHIAKELFDNPSFRVIRQLGRFNQVREQPLNALGYIVTRPFAEYVVANHPVCEMPIDHLYATLSYRGNYYMPIRPLIGIRDDVPSVIQATKYVRDYV